MSLSNHSIAKGILISSIVILGLPAISNATVVLNTVHYDCPQPGCQTVNFVSNSGSTIQGNTNPAPVYNVYVDSLASGVSIHGNGSNVNNAAGNGSGLLSILLYPEAGWGWSLIDFQLDSLNKDQPTDIGGLSFTAIDQFGVSWVMPANFPWEGNSGENQHYRIDALNGELIKSLRIDYTDPLQQGNMISDMHNIDVKSDVAPVSVPASVWLMLSGIGGLGAISRKRKTVAE